MDLIAKAILLKNDLLAKAIELIENTKQFAENRGVSEVHCLFDFIPDEILYNIILKVGGNASIVSKRFNDVYLMYHSAIIHNIYSNFTNNNPNWLDDILKHNDVIDITERALILGLSISTNQHKKSVKLIRISGKYCIKYRGITNRNYKYELYFTNGNISNDLVVKRKYEVNTYDGLQDKFYHNEIISHGGHFQSVGTSISDESCNYICTKPNTPYLVAFDYYIIISDGTETIVSTIEELSSYTFNGLDYHLPKKDHPKYKEIMRILNGENSPIPIDMFDYMPY